MSDVAEQCEVAIERWRRFSNQRRMTMAMAEEQARATERLYTRKEVEEVAGQAAGMASAVFMQMHPHDVMPSEDLITGIDRVLSDYDRENPEAVEVAYFGWTVIANAYGGDWTRATEEWQTAAALFRDQFHRLIERRPEAKPVESGVAAVGVGPTDARGRFPEVHLG